MWGWGLLIGWEGGLEGGGGGSSLRAKKGAIFGQEECLIAKVGWFVRFPALRVYIISVGGIF